VASGETREALHRFGLARDQLSAALAGAAGLTASELAALEQLELNGPMSQRQLGERLALSSGGTTLLVDRLERAGLVVRRPHPADRRAVRLELSRPDAGLTAVEDYEEAVTALVRRLSADERQVVTEFLRAAAAEASGTAERLRLERASRRRRGRPGRSRVPGGKTGRDPAG